MKEEYELILQKENIKKIDYVKNMKQYFLDYAMSVLIGRALPDVRDGLKPVHRRILFAMQELGLYPDKGYRKCARVVGDVLGKFHPHSDTSVYDALVRMAQDFSMRMILVDGHGNFGSIDGDGASAMRYTESKMSKIAIEMLRDINKNTVDFMPNFDGEEQEPVVLPSRYPNLLVNGSSGIAVGFSTNIPSHNLRDVTEQTIYQIDNPNCTIEDLVNILKAPDFGTGGYIVNPQDMVKMYTEGEGKTIIRGKYHIEGNKIVFTEIPYGVNKQNLMIALLRLKDGYTKITKEDNKKKETFIKPKIPQITDLHDLSDGKTGIRIEITVDLECNIDKILKLLFQNSDLQCNFSAIFTAVKDDKLFRKLSLKDINKYYIEHQKDVIRRRSQFDLDKAQARQHILEGLVKALLDIDKTISIIRASKNNTEASEQLINKIKLTQKQAESVLEMKLRRLTSLEIEKLQGELLDISKFVAELKNIINNESVLLEVLKNELSEIQERYGEERKTEIISEDSLDRVDVKDISIEDYNCRIFYTNKYIKKHLKQSDNHKYVEGNMVLGDIITNNKATLLVFTNKGNRFKIQCSELEQYTPSAFGSFMPELLNFEDDEQIIKILSIPTNGYKQKNIYFIYENGKIAKVNADSYMSNNKKLQNCYNTDSKLMDIYYSEKDIDILLCSSEGKALIVNTSQLNSKGSRNAQGVTSMKLEDNIIIGCIIDINKDSSFTLQTQKGKEKEFVLSDIAPTNKSNEERNVYQYIQGKCGNQGNFLINTRNTQDSIASLTLNKQ